MDGRVLVDAARATARERLLIAGSRGEVGVIEAGSQVAALECAVEALTAAGVAHALIGGLAVGVRTGVPRATLDVDLAVPSSIPRAHVIAAMTAAGFRLTGEHPHSLNFRHPNDEPVQLASDPAFDPMIDRAEALQVGAFELRVVTHADLVAMKSRAAADPARRRSKALRDRADLELLRGDVPDPDEGW